MSSFGLSAVLARELLSGGRLARSVSELSALSEQDIITTMTTGGRVDGRTAAGYLFHSAQICAAIAGCRTVVDLGCGTGEQLFQVAELNPETRFVGVDRAQGMLDVAAAQARERQLDNVEFLRAELTHLQALETGSVDGVISTMTLHHLPDAQSAADCLDEMRRILSPGGAVYIEDFGRLRSERSIDYFVRRGDEGAPDAFSSLYRASLHAAFTAGELRELAAAHLPEAVRFYRTIPIPFLVVLATPPRGSLSQSQRAGLRRLHQGLDAGRRRDYRELSLAFRLGGLRDVLPAD